MEWHMKETEVNNPFVVGKYLSDRYFCDRKEETEFQCHFRQVH